MWVQNQFATLYSWSVESVSPEQRICTHHLTINKLWSLFVVLGDIGFDVHLWVVCLFGGWYCRNVSSILCSVGTFSIVHVIRCDVGFGFCHETMGLIIWC